MITKLVLSIFSVAILLTSTRGEEPSLLLKDDFSSADHPLRRAQRGPWQIADGVATCLQDDELYKKYKDHGPIIFYDLNYDSATVSYHFKAKEGTKTVVFTANSEEGHVFRLISSAAGTTIRAFPPSPDHKSISLGTFKEQPLKLGEWTKVKVELKGKIATIHIGDSFTKTVEHESFAKAKSNLSIGFSFGEVSIKDWLVTK